MTRPVPDRLVSLWHEQHHGGTVFALIAAILAILAGLGAHVGSLSSFDLACFALAAVALHLLWPTTPFAGR